jgi:hypothetical protein
VGALGGVVFVLGVELVRLGCFVVFRHAGFPLLLVFPVSWMRIGGAGMSLGAAFLRGGGGVPPTR